MQKTAYDFRISDWSSDVCSSDLEAKIRPSDRAELRPGLDAMIKVTAYDFSIHGGLPATLIDISADTIVEDKGDKRGESFYRIRLRTDRNSLGPEQPDRKSTRLNSSH